jgi:hypothetical protein
LPRFGAPDAGTVSASRAGAALVPSESARRSSAGAFDTSVAVVAFVAASAGGVSVAAFEGCASGVGLTSPPIGAGAG